MGQLSLSPTTHLGDANLRHFCFYLSDHQTNFYFSCDDASTKENWKEQIVTQLTILRKSHRRTESVERAKIRNSYLDRPIIYIKIVQGRDLTPMDLNGTSDPFVEITVGSSIARTTTRKKTLNPEWGMVFPFDWDRRDRFAKVSFHIFSSFNA